MNPKLNVKTKSIVIFIRENAKIQVLVNIIHKADAEILPNFAIGIYPLLNVNELPNAQKLIVPPQQDIITMINFSFAKVEVQDVLICL